MGTSRMVPEFYEHMHGKELFLFFYIYGVHTCIDEEQYISKSAFREKTGDSMRTRATSLLRLGFAQLSSTFS